MKERIFSSPSIEEALRECQTEGYQTLFLPQLADRRIESPSNSDIWRYFFDTLSIRAIGRTKQGNPIVVYAHLPNYFSNSDNIGGTGQLKDSAEEYCLKKNFINYRL